MSVNVQRRRGLGVAQSSGRGNYIAIGKDHRCLRVPEGVRVYMKVKAVLFRQSGIVAGHGVGRDGCLQRGQGEHIAGQPDDTK